ncbi:MAG: hypothetical protein ABI663_11760 [Chryseolinea sp.]
MAHISIFIIILFIVTTFFIVWLFYKASGKSKTVLFVLGAWMLLQAVVGLSGFYQQEIQSVPPRFIFLIAPGLLLIILLFLTKKGRVFIDSLQLRELTLLHTIRIFVELTLCFMFSAKLIPLLMTFEGFNFDILSGLTAPIVYYLVFIIKRAEKKFLLIWNFLCLALLVNIVTLALLSLPTPFQKLAFEQPNVGLSYFPFVWLPCVVVPIVLFSHLVSIRRLLILPAEDKI